MAAILRIARASEARPYGNVGVRRMGRRGRRPLRNGWGWVQKTAPSEDGAVGYGFKQIAM